MIFSEKWLCSTSNTSLTLYEITTDNLEIWLFFFWYTVCDTSRDTYNYTTILIVSLCQTKWSNELNEKRRKIEFRLAPTETLYFVQLSNTLLYFHLFCSFTISPSITHSWYVNFLLTNCINRKISKPVEQKVNYTVEF